MIPINFLGMDWTTTSGAGENWIKRSPTPFFSNASLVSLVFFWLLRGVHGGYPKIDGYRWVRMENPIVNG